MHLVVWLGCGPNNVRFGWIDLSLFPGTTAQTLLGTDSYVRWREIGSVFTSRSCLVHLELVGPNYIGSSKVGKQREKLFALRGRQFCTHMDNALVSNTLTCQTGPGTIRLFANRKSSGTWHSYKHRRSSNGPSQSIHTTIFQRCLQILDHRIQGRRIPFRPFERTHTNQFRR